MKACVHIAAAQEKHTDRTDWCKPHQDPVFGNLGALCARLASLPLPRKILEHLLQEGSCSPPVDGHLLDQFALQGIDLRQNLVVGGHGHDFSTVLQLLPLSLQVPFLRPCTTMLSCPTPSEALAEVALRMNVIGGHKLPSG